MKNKTTFPEISTLWIDYNFYPIDVGSNKNIVIYIHGFGNNKDSSKAKKISDIAHQNWYNFMSFSFRWNWKSQWTFEKMTLSSNIEDLKNVINCLSKYYSIILVWSSFWASSVIWYLSKEWQNNWNIKKTILLAPVLKLQDRLQDKFGIDFRDKLKQYGHIDFYHFKDKKEAKLTLWFFNDLCLYNLEESLSEITLPITIIHWTQDKVINAKYSIKYAKSHKNIETLLVEDDHNISNNISIIDKYL